MSLLNTQLCGGHVDSEKRLRIMHHFMKASDGLITSLSEAVTPPVARVQVNEHLGESPPRLSIYYLMTLTLHVNVWTSHKLTL